MIIERCIVDVRRGEGWVVFVKNLCNGICKKCRGNVNFLRASTEEWMMCLRKGFNLRVAKQMRGSLDIEKRQFFSMEENE